MKIGFIGLGNMASAMIGGFLKQGIAAPGDLLGSAKTLATRTKMAEKFGNTECETNSQVAAAADVLILAVKPVFLAEVIEEVRRQVRPDTLVISVAAGKTLDFLREAFGDAKVRLVRVMPNTPALVGEGCTGVCFGEGVSQEQQEFALKLMNAFGKAYAVPESAAVPPPLYSCSWRPWRTALWRAACPESRRMSSRLRPCWGARS